MKKITVFIFFKDFFAVYSVFDYSVLIHGLFSNNIKKMGG